MQAADNPIEQCVVDETLREMLPSVDPENPPDMNVYLIAFNDGSYKKIRAVSWKHSQWMHFTLGDGTVVRVNPDKVNYLHQGVA